MGSQFPSATDFARSDETGTLSRLGLAKQFRGNHQRRGVVKMSEFGVKPIAYSGARVNDEVNVMVRDMPVKA